MVSIALHVASWQMFSVYEVEEVVEAEGLWQRGGGGVVVPITIQTFAHLQPLVVSN